MFLNKPTKAVVNKDVLELLMGMGRELPLVLNPLGVLLLRQGFSLIRN